MSSVAYGDGVSARRLHGRVAEPEPVSPELVLVCPELRAQVLAQMQAAAHAPAGEQPAAAPSADGRTGDRPPRRVAALLVAVPLSLLAGAWLEATLRSAPTQAVLVAAPEGPRTQIASPLPQRAAASPPRLAASSQTRVSPAVGKPVKTARKAEPARTSRAKRPARAIPPLRLTGVETEPPVSLLGPLPDPTPARRRLAPTVGRQLVALAQARRVSWALLLARARTHGVGGMQAITLRELKPLAHSLAMVATRQTPNGRPAASGRPGKRERVVAGYDRAVGLDALISGLAAAKPVLAARVLRDPRITIYPGGRRDVATGRVDVRVLALLLYLAQTQGQVTVTSLVSGHDAEASGKGSSAHSYGVAVDISALASMPVRGHQRPGGRISTALRTLRLLPAEVRPTQVLSLLDLGPGSLALADHSSYVHVGYAPVTHNTPDSLRALWQSAGARYGVPWQILAAINKIETDNGQVLGTSSAGAIGWMQFLPSTWRRWGVDANGDGTANPLDPADAIYSAARYLQAAGADTNLRRALYAYNHAPWYVKRVLAQARTYH